MPHPKTIISAVVLCLLASTSGWAEEKFSKYVKVFEGPDNAEVSVLFTKDKKSALFAVSGVETPIDGLVLRCRVGSAGLGKTDLHTRYKGSAWHIFREQKSNWGGYKYAMAWIPGIKGTSRLRYDKKASKKAKAADLIAKHEKQKRDGSLGKVQGGKTK